MKKIKTRFYACDLGETIRFDFLPSHDNVQVFYRFGQGNLILANGNTFSFPVASTQVLVEVVVAFKTDEGVCRIGIRGSNGGTDEDKPSVKPDMIYPAQRRYHFLVQ